MARQFVLDFSQIPDNSIPEGEYDATLNQVTIKDSKQGEYPYLNWEFDMTGELQGRKQWMMTSLSPKALFKLKQVVDGLGLPADAISNLDFDDNDRLISPNLDGIPVRVKIETREYQGQIRSQVATIVECYVDLVGEPEDEELLDDEDAISEDEIEAEEASV